MLFLNRLPSSSLALALVVWYCCDVANNNHII